MMFITSWLTLGILSLVGLSQVAGLNIQGPWDINFTADPDEDMNTCKPYKDKIEQAYDQVGEIVSTTWVSLESLRYDRPEADEAVTFARDLWDLADRTLQAFFGVSVNPANAQTGMWWQQIQDVFEPMDKTLQGDVNRAKYKPTLKPAIACGTKGWRYIAPDDPDPEDPEENPLRDTKDPKKASLFRETGAWYWNHRYLWMPRELNGVGSNTEEINLCTGARGVTSVQEDLITICDSALGEQATLDWMRVSLGTHLDDITGNIMSYNLAKVIDPQAVNSGRQLLYIRSDNPDISTPYPGPPDNPNKPLIAYGVPYILWLANGHPKAKQPRPDLVVNTADAYSNYAMANYLDQWDWSKDGFADWWSGTY
ncbi:hypothetical protein O1611_g9308 [Lasiodiplodia mahajangana]|uniref:Uncharacterized protein n=1 Tax=Lasiodiplodia mahajangana TaxID=1108764 RepID=A0ACC2JAK1_9PEZI|nr:hypothetical protein O1611_g9308 [Lasiodiplodia mahajangana]